MSSNDKDNILSLNKKVFKIIRITSHEQMLLNCIEDFYKDKENAKKLIGQFGESVSLHEYKLGPDLIINCSSAGHHSSVPEFFHDLKISKDCTLYDLSYGSPHKPTRNWFKKYSQYIYSGEGMLVEQAALSFEYWFGKKPTTKNIIKEIP